MAKVEVDSVGTVPTGAKAKPGIVYATDDLGRHIGIRKLGPLERMRLFKVIGPINAKNDQYMGYAMLAYSVAEMDGEPVAPPATELQMEALVQRLGEEGFDALGRAQLELMGVTEEDMAAAEGDPSKALQIATERRSQEAKAAAKN